MKKWGVIEAFGHLGTETRDRYAWSAQSPDGAITAITLWTDEIEDDGTHVSVDYFNHPKVAIWSTQRGNNARKRHLQHVWDTDRQFRVVLLQARDKSASPRSAMGRWPDDNLLMHLTALDLNTGAFRAEGSRAHPKPSEWTDQELAACVEAYHRLWAAQADGDRLNKSELRRSVLSELQNRSESAYEMRMQNISAVIAELGLPYVRGYLPLHNIGQAKERIIALINKHWDRDHAMEGVTAIPADLETRVQSAKMKMARGNLPVPKGSANVTRIAGSTTTFARDPNVIAWVLEQADGICEACCEEAPFMRGDGTPYLEVHHIRPLAEGGPDTVDNAIAACPNCHRRLHHSDDRETYRKKIIGRVTRLKDYRKRKFHHAFT